MLMMGDEILANELPPGYRFSPTELELIAYLFLRMLGMLGLHQVVKDIDPKKFYGEHPSAIVNFTSKEEESAWYFFIHDKHTNTKKEGELRKFQLVKIFKSLLKDVFGRRTSFGKLEDLIIRSVGKEEYFENEKEQVENGEQEQIREVGNGIGVWKSFGKEDSIYDMDGKILAFKTYFVYYKRFQNKYKKTHWRMEEYQLTTGRRRDQKIAGCVLGRITRGTNYSND